MINRVLGSGKFTLTALIIVLVLSKVAYAQGGNSRDDNFTDCDEIQVLRIPPLPSCRGTTQLKQNPQWIVVVMSSYIPYMAIDVPISRVYGPERLSRFGPYSDRADCIQATENPDNPVLNNYYEYMGYYVECWALDKWYSYHARWRERTIGFYDKLIFDLTEQLPEQNDPLLRQALLREIQFHKDNLKWELEGP